MKQRDRRYHDTRGRAGFTVIECLIGLAISAMLMTALAVAFNASIVNFRENEDMFQSINRARQAMARMTSQLRTAGYADPNGVWWGVVQAAPSNQCEFWTSGGQHDVYEYRDASHGTDPNTLMLITNGSAYTLCDNVTAASFTKTAAADPADAKSVLISLTVQTGQSQRTLAAAAAVRRSLP